MENNLEAAQSAVHIFSSRETSVSKLENPFIYLYGIKVRTITFSSMINLLKSVNIASINTSGLAVILFWLQNVGALTRCPG